MQRKRIIGWSAAAVATLSLAYVVVGSWQAANLLDSTLRVGAPTAQSSGWPAPEEPVDIGYEGDPRQAYGYTFENVTLSGELGDLPAWLISPQRPDASAPWAIFVHGIGGRRENGYRFLPTLRQVGFPVLMVSYRNDSDAAADPSSLYAFGLTEWRDLDTAVRYAMENGAPSVVLVAESMGGGIVGQFLRHSDVADTASAVILDAPAIDFLAVLTRQMDHMHLPLAPVLARGALLISDWKTPIRLGDADTTAELASYPGPVFLSHGFADSIVPIGSSDTLVSERTHVTEYLRTGSDHIQSYKVDPSRFVASLTAFLTTLQSQGGQP